MFRFRIDRTQADFGAELQRRFSEAVKHHASALTFRRMLETRHTPGQQGAGTPSRAVYISYALDDVGGVTPSREEIVNRLEASLRSNGYDVRRDKTNLRYTGLISEFMKEIGRGGCVVAVISDKYLRSVFCMHELLEVYRNREFHRRLCPVVLPGTHLTFFDRLAYVNYWSSQFEQVEDLFRKIEPTVLSPQILDEFQMYLNVSEEAGNLIGFIAGDMNYATHKGLEENDFAILRDRIDQCLQ